MQIQILTEDSNDGQFQSEVNTLVESIINHCRKYSDVETFSYAGLCSIILASKIAINISVSEWCVSHESATLIMIDDIITSFTIDARFITHRKVDKF